MVVVTSRLRLITYSEEVVDGQPIHVSSHCAPVKARNQEPAGHSFHAAALRISGLGEEEGSVDDDEKSDTASEKSQSHAQASESYSSKGRKKTATGEIQQDHYALLGLAHLRYLATEDQIRKSYREVALKHHPDKQAALLLLENTEAAKAEKKEEIENRFKAIQESYEILMDPVRRRIYDSTDEFDDEIPTDCAPQDFFKVFGPAFMRNGRWSVTQPIPTLGDDTTTLREVDTFYNFWYGFKSWREFPHSDEFDLEQAESRDHKRWMERQNAKLSEKARKEEAVRIRQLVDNAYKRDPRILRRKETEKAEKQKKKEAKIMAKKMQEEEAARIIEEEKRKKEEEEKKAAEAASAQKKIREKEKKLLRKEKSRLRTLCAPIVSQKSYKISSDDIENLCSSLDMEKLKNLCDKLDGAEELQALKTVIEALGRDPNIPLVVEKMVEKEVRNPPQQNGSSEAKANGQSSVFTNKEKKEKPWTKEEVDLLRKGVLKFPKGTSKRWEVVSDYIGTGRSVEEILKATKTVLLQKPDSGKAFDHFLEKRKAAPTIDSPLSTRVEVDGVPNNNASEAILTNNKSAASPNKSEVSAAKPDEPPTEPANQAKPEAVVSEDGDSAGGDPEAWSAVQERALVQALKTFPKEVNQRWERVAAAVPGKTVGQCKKKFALLKEFLRNKKNAV